MIVSPDLYCLEYNELLPFIFIKSSLFSSNSASKYLVTIYPLLARSIEGLNNSSIGNDPNFLCISKIAEIVPGTPTANPPIELNPGITSPSSF